MTKEQHQIGHIAVNARMLGLTLEGLGRFTYEMAAGWIQQYPEIRFTLLFDRPVQLDPPLDAASVVIGQPTSHVVSITIWNEVALTRWLNKHQPDLYISPDGFIPLRVKCRCVPVVHDVAPLVYPQFMRWRDYLYYRAFQVRMIRRAWKVSTVSHFSKREIMRVAEVSDEQVFVAYSGLRANFRDPPSHRPAITQVDYPYFVYYGSIHPRKNVIGTIRAFERYRQLGGEAHLVLCGRMAWKAEEIREAMDTSAYGAYIHHIDYPDDASLYYFIKGAIATVFVSHYEGFGQPVLESMALGTAVITSADSPMSEIGGDAVETCRPLDVEGTAQKMLVVDQDDTYRAAMVARGQEQHLKFTYPKESKRFMDYILDHWFDDNSSATADSSRS